MNVVESIQGLEPLFREILLALLALLDPLGGIVGVGIFITESSTS